MTTVAEVQRPIQSIIDERIKLFEVVIVVAPAAHTHFNARVACEAAVPAGCLVFAVGGDAARLGTRIFQKLLFIL